MGPSMRRLTGMWSQNGWVLISQATCAAHLNWMQYVCRTVLLRPLRLAYLCHPFPSNALHEWPVFMWEWDVALVRPSFLVVRCTAASPDATSTVSSHASSGAGSCATCLHLLSLPSLAGPLPPPQPVCGQGVHPRGGQGPGRGHHPKVLDGIHLLHDWAVTCLSLPG